MQYSQTYTKHALSHKSLFVVLRIDPRALHMLDKDFTTE